MPVPDFSPGEVLTAAAMDSISGWLVKTQTVGTAVSSVTVTGAFSADYDNYFVTVTGGVASTTINLNLTLGATATGYYYGGVFTPYSGVSSLLQGNNAAFWLAGVGNTNTLGAQFTVLNPFNTKNTFYSAPYFGPTTTSGGSSLAGFLNNTTSYTAFTLTTSSGTMTGGTIRVYGYRN